MKKKQRNSIVSVLDIGSTKVVCLIASINSHNQHQIIGIGYNVASGIKAGRITDVKSAEYSIAQAISSAEKMAGETIKSLYVNISSNNLISHHASSDLMVTGHEISDKDLNRLLFQALDKYNDQELETIHSFAYDYILDGNRGIENPLGMFGNKLSADFHIVLSPSMHLMNLTNCLAKCQLEVENFISSAFASGIACLTAEELELGVTLIEFGGSCTSISIFNKGHMLYTDAVPIGGINITNDIASIFSTDFANAERIKTLYGTTVMTSADFDEPIEIPVPSHSEDIEVSTINKSELVEVIRARIDEILDIIRKKLEISNTHRFSGNKIVITGGGSQLSGIKEIVSHQFSKSVRVGYPKTLNGLADSTTGIAFSTPIGLLLHAVEQETKSYFHHPAANDSSPFSSVMQWLKENFG